MTRFLSTNFKTRHNIIFHFLKLLKKPKYINALHNPYRYSTNNVGANYNYLYMGGLGLISNYKLKKLQKSFEYSQFPRALWEMLMIALFMHGRVEQRVEQTCLGCTLSANYYVVLYSMLTFAFFLSNVSVQKNKR